MRTAPLWKFAEVNPSTAEFSRLEEGDEVTFLPLETIWPGGRADYSRTLAWSTKLSYTMFQSGDVLVPKITPTFEAGRSIVAAPLTALGLATTEVHVVRPREGVDARFLCFAFQSIPFLKEGESALQGVGNLRRVSPMFMQTFPVLDAPLPIQRAIADYLDRETGEIDAMLGKLDALTGVLETRRDVAIDNALQGLPMVRFFSALELSQTGPFGTQLAASEYVDGGVPLINPTHISGGRVWPESHISVSPEKAQELSRHLLRPGDIILGRKGDVDKAAIVSEDILPALCGSDAMLLRPRPECSAGFITYFFHSKQCHAFLESMSVGAAVSGLNQRTISELRIPLPPLPEQRRIADHLDEVTGRIDAMLAKVAQLKALLLERRAALITDVVTGRKEVA